MGGISDSEENKSIDVSERKEWVHAGGYKHPPMFGFGPGIEQNTHKAVDQRASSCHCVSVAFECFRQRRLIPSTGADSQVSLFRDILEHALRLPLQ